MKEPKYTKFEGLVGEKSFSLVLPKDYAEKLGIEKGDFVKVTQTLNQILIEKAQDGDTNILGAVFVGNTHLTCHHS
jgi:bifunctional DNA-binding transcriptional regulator/antitoxin component of YhaV-PrlF toxin-antitoxin module